jgi:acetyl-CoA carboxylase carboxyl transferase subunit alpha
VAVPADRAYPEDPAIVCGVRSPPGAFPPDRLTAAAACQHSCPMAQPDEDGFEQPIIEIERRIEELSGFEDEVKKREIDRLRARLDQLRREIFARLTPWQTTLVARHPRRPYTLDLVSLLFEDFVEVHGDRYYADDPAIVCGFALYHGRPAAVIGHQKGRDTKEKLHRNFGMPRPEGYRKALRLMRLAEKFGRPIFCFVDTPGAYPGLDAEERGQGEAIARNLREMITIRSPILVTVTGEGGSGGALAIAIGDRVNMLEHAIYSVISSEGCAAILWRDAGRAKEAARALRLTARDLRELELIDEIVPEPLGGAHTEPTLTAALIDSVLKRQLHEVASLDAESRLRERYEKFRRMGRFTELAV